MENNFTMNITAKASSAYEELPISYPVRFWIYLLSEVISLPCCLFTLYQFLSNRNLREALNNHLIILILLIDLVLETFLFPLIIHYYRLDGNWQVSRPFSKLWSYTNFGFFPTQTIVFAWCTIERHILIFHNHWVSTTKKRILIHYIPLIVIPLYCLIYYAVSVFYSYSICEYVDVQSTVVGIYLPCFILIPIHFKVDLILHQIIPILIIIISTFALFFRFLHQRVRMKQSLQWKKQRKLIIQVLSIFIIFGIFQFPWTILQLCSLFGLSLDSLQVTQNFMFFFDCYVVFLFPFVCLATLPEIEKKFQIFYFWRKQQRTIVPAQVPNQNETY
ncbi:unnamed protein product [Adineta ricciae]|uniref:G-protein coupled receptors family 1 profile domain-containing protein n=1 Tax=Adineta ricciae TaxID=249248 RepID=A0A815V2K3_ADIRI|nr:unnamed protein product [Adineta ricciae]CAF1560652.1 unnamed protein product [Adineta ricciae]